ncbi:unnamed protein product [Moneuplotes crassus]|uniref:Glutaredoxin domain-containing protein n=1 Tax=Euplotes crassus TaxID=5936 RepID=A0AAD1XXI3_EUPCR|nr:unnamed protein product [Moneuplotes crassus]
MKFSWMNKLKEFAKKLDYDSEDPNSGNVQNLDNYQTTKAFITNTLRNNDVVLFMKGTSEMPQCGFSNYVVQVFKFYKVKDFHVVNVLDSDMIREGIKKYSNWPTIPQIYIKEEFIGGSDIIKEMHMDGSLEHLLQREKLI